MDFLYPTMLFLIIGLMMVAVCAQIAPHEERPWLARTLVLALLARLAVATVFAAVPESRVFHEDAYGYEIAGRNLALSWQGELPPIYIYTEAGQNLGWPYVCGALCYLFGQYSALPSCFNCVVGTCTVFLVYFLARQFFHVLVARRAALMAAFVPSMILWSSIAIKDAVMAFLILVALLSCVMIKKRFSFVSLLGIVGSLLAIHPIRFYMLYFVGFAIVTSLFLERGLGLVSGVYKQVMLIGVMVALMAMVGIAGRMQSGLEIMTFERVSAFRHGMAVTANSGFEADVDVSTPTRALLFLPLGVSELLLGPFPWQWGSMRALMAAPETIYWWILFPSTLSGMWWMFRKRFTRTSALLIFAVTMTPAYSLMHGNIGSGFRQRAQIFVILFIFASLGVYGRRCARAGIDPDLLLVDRDPPPEAKPQPRAAKRLTRATMETR
jgi:hypothetical protein